MVRAAGTEATDTSIGEESFAAGSRPEMTDEPTFCVDPIGAYPVSQDSSCVP